MEGVMMRGPERVAVAVRRYDGRIVVKSEPYVSLAKKIKPLGWPFLRGAVVLIESIILGVRALNFSGDVVMEQQGEKSRAGGLWMGFTVLFAFLFGLGLFFYLPLWLTELFRFRSGILFNLVDGVFRMIIFLAYLYLISRWKEIERIFQYHGAEHKSIFAFETHGELNVESARPFKTAHPRCGTSFLAIVMAVSIVVFMFLGHPENLAERLIRLSFVPLIGGISYELIKISDRGLGDGLLRLLISPGLWLQKITTREPDDRQLEVAMVALKSALAMEPRVGPSEVESA